MAKNEEDIRQILERYRQGNASDDDLAFLESWYPGYYHQPEEDMPVTERIAAVDHVWASLAQQTQPAGVKRMYRWRIAVAAVAAACITSVAVVIWHQSNAPMNTAQLANSKSDIPPGLNQATLTDAIGQTVALDTTQSGLMLTNETFRYNNGGAISGIQSSDNNTGKVTAMKLQTPRGGSYQITLPDGSKVWLNAATSLSFPSSFEGAAERRVSVNGEAYFEIAANARQPFRVNSGNENIEVLGTQFNINNYGDEPAARTTLVSGSVRVNTTILQPGEQMITNASGSRVTTVNTDAVTGWRNNYIVFQNERIESVMRTISRWYDVEIVYEGEHPDDDFAGRVSKHTYVSQVLKKLELTNKVHFKIKGRTIIVTK
jgi:transmembrane sensor